MHRPRTFVGATRCLGGLAEPKVASDQSVEGPVGQLLGHDSHDLGVPADQIARAWLGGLDRFDDHLGGGLGGDPAAL